MSSPLDLVKERAERHEEPIEGAVTLAQIPQLKDVFLRIPEDGPYTIAVVGGGGKSSFIYRYAKLLKDRGFHVGITTTTKLENNHPLISVVDRWIIGGVPSSKSTIMQGGEGSVTLFAKSSTFEKLYGYNPRGVDNLKKLPHLQVLLVEADGSRGIPLKCPGEDEPVIPDSTDMVVGVLGLSALGELPSDRTIHRLERFQELPGVQLNQPISLDTYDLLFQEEQGLFKGSPRGIKRVQLCNQIETLSHEIRMILVADFKKRGYYGVSLLPSKEEE